MSAYVHFPFCRHICDFCGYETRLIGDGLSTGFPQRAVEQVRRRLGVDDVSHARLAAIFFGGGTASLIPERSLSSILEVLLPLAPIGEPPEATLECEPGTITLRRLRHAKSSGINRISVGAQSMSDIRLERIGRKHSAEDVVRLVESCRDADLQNIHIDLIYGLMEQTLAEWEQTLQRVVMLRPAHVSIYKLFVFLFGALHRGNVAPRPEAERPQETDLLRSMYTIGQAILAAAGYEQYTLTEFALPGWRSQYIASCFNGNDILPIGPSAFGRCGNELWENTPYLHEYVSHPEFGSVRALRLSPIEEFKRDVILGLWLLSVDLERLAGRSRLVVSEPLIELLRKLSMMDQLAFDGRTIRVEAHQCFEVGQAMEALAQLPGSSWAQSIDDASGGATTQEETIAILPGHLGTLLRTARRDKVLYEALCEQPQRMLREYCADLPGDQAEVLSTIILAKRDVQNEGLDPEILRAWLAVKAEHAAPSVEP